MEAISALLEQALRSFDGAGNHIETALVAHTGSEWSGWWQTVLARLDGPTAGLCDALQAVQDSMDADIAARKDIGAFRDPGRFLVKVATQECKRAGVRWPDFPAPRKVCGDTVAPSRRQF